MPIHLPSKTTRGILFDWGDTLMRTYPQAQGPMFTWPRVEALPGAVETLEKLAESWTLAVASNASESDEAQIHQALERVNLDRYLDEVYCFRRIGYKKPSAQFFNFIFEDLKLDASRLVMVGDSWEADILGANQNGIRAIWLNEKDHEDRSGDLCQTIHALPELLTVL